MSAPAIAPASSWPAGPTPEHLAAAHVWAQIRRVRQLRERFDAACDEIDRQLQDVARIIGAPRPAGTAQVPPQ